MNYSQMSDFEINCAVARALAFEPIMFFDVDSSICNGPVWNVASGVTDEGIKVSRGAPFNPCNSWSDAGPVIAGNGISILKDGGLYLWCASSSAYWADGSEWKTGQDVMHSNPLRAAMIAFLMTREQPDAA